MLQRVRQVEDTTHITQIPMVAVKHRGFDGIDVAIAVTMLAELVIAMVW